MRATSSGEALDLRAALHRQIDTLTAAMTRALDAAGIGDAIVHLPRLEVRARIASVDDVGDVLAQRIEHALHQELSALRGRSPGAGPASTAAGDDRAVAVERAQAASGDGGEPAGGAQPLSGERARVARGVPVELPARLALLVHYLETGALPWPLANLGTAAALAELRDAAVADPLRVADSLSAAPGLRAQHARWFRWLQLVPDAMWPIVARAAASGDGGALRVEIVAALSSAPVGWLSRHARLELAAAAIVVARDGTAVADPAELAAVVQRALGAAGGEPAGETAPHDRSAARGPSPGGADRADRSGSGVGISGEAAAARAVAAAALAARLPEPAASAFRRWLATPRRPDAGAAHTGAADLAADVAAAREVARHAAPPAPWPRVEPAAPAPHAARPAASPAAAPFGEMVPCAGLVLLHPYLPRFFEGTHVKRAGAPALLAGELPRAAALLHLAATGDPEPFELELGLIKLLLGLPLDAALPVSGGLVGAADREEVDALLGAVVEHWSALKRTSVQGLRVSFLQRPGLLREDGPGFRLQVEPAPFDMLLAQLPWGLSVVKLSWMTRPIFTDWPAP